jgi:hypothetical protein
MKIVFDGISCHEQGIILRVLEPDDWFGQSYSIVRENVPQFSLTISSNETMTGYDPLGMKLRFSTMSISRNHAQITFSRQGERQFITLRDNLSIQGTFVLRNVSNIRDQPALMEKEVRRAGKV